MSVRLISIKGGGCEVNITPNKLDTAWFAQCTCCGWRNALDVRLDLIGRSLHHLETEH